MKLTWIAIAGVVVVSARADEAGDVETFLGNYCLECHDDLTDEGERNFESLIFPLESESAIITTHEIIDQLVLGEMPPKDHEAKPTAEESLAVIQQLRSQVTLAHSQLESTGRETILRRLNRREYRNTVQDLLGVNVTGYDPTRDFPTDNVVDHMDNLGDQLVTSGFLLDQYLNAADELVEKALSPKEQPEVKTQIFEGGFVQQPELNRAHKEAFDFKYIGLYENPKSVTGEGAFAPVGGFEDGVEYDGFYEIKFRAKAANRKNPYDAQKIGYDPREPFRLGVVPGRRSAGVLYYSQVMEPILAEVTLKDEVFEDHTVRVFLHKGQTIRFTFPNGVADHRRAVTAIAKNYPESLPEEKRGDLSIEHVRRAVIAHAKLPHIRISRVEVKGPLYETWPPPAQREMFQGESFDPTKRPAMLKAFIARAFRRPVTDAEVKPFLDLMATRDPEGTRPREAFADAMKAVLCSPSFLYLSEPAKVAPGAMLSAHDLAARLSYFFWASMPDAELREVADSGALLDDATLEAQFARMIEDPRSDEFVAGFLDSWLNLRALGDMPPDRSAFAQYYSEDLEHWMREETRRFTIDLLEADRPVRNFLSADYAYLNLPLINLYGMGKDEVALAQLNWKRPQDLQRVALTDWKRGGLLGMGAIHTVTSNGVETSPILRGVWLLENLLGTPPPPPPDEVPLIDPDTRGSTTVRNQLEKHREDPACYDCHRKIDPLGFAMENFDPIGAWRSHYSRNKRQGPPVDSSGELANGKPFRNVKDFKALMVEREELFLHHLTDRLLTYATGRRMEPLDQVEVELIASSASGEVGAGLRTLVREVVMSRLFRAP